MGRIKKFFMNLGWKKSSQIIFFFFSMIALIIVYYFSVDMLEQKLFKVSADDFSWVYQIDSFEEKDDMLEIRGWAFALNQEAKKESFDILLYNSETDDCVYPKMKYESREDVNSYFLCEYDYTDSGFFAFVPKKDLNNQTYEILLRPEGGQSAIATDVFYVNGQMMFTNPEEYKPLEVEGTELEEIVCNGILRVYRPDFGMYVYQYEGDLYWVAESDYDFFGGGPTIQYQMDTTQSERLPEERLNNNWLWSNLNFSFYEYEIVEWNTGKYRVAKYRIPEEYSITYIWTGCHTDDWVWRANFRPFYELKNAEN